MLFHLSAVSVLLAIVFCQSLSPFSFTALTSSPSIVIFQLERVPTDPSVIVYYRHRIFAILSPYLPSSLVAKITHYTPLTSFSFTDQAAAGISSRNFDLEENLGEGSGESRMGLDQAGVEEVRRIMYVCPSPPR